MVDGHDGFEDPAVTYFLVSSISKSLLILKMVASKQVSGLINGLA